MRPGWAALALIAAVLGALWTRQPVRPLSIFDQPFYLGIAHDLVHNGRFTDGFMFAKPGTDGRRAPGMRFGPFYPGLIAAASKLDSGLRGGMDCVVATEGRDSGCPTEASSIRALQMAELFAVLWLTWWLGAVVGGQAVGWFALLLALATAPLLLGSVEMVMTEVTALALTTAASAAGVAAWRASGGARLAWCGMAGRCTGAGRADPAGFSLSAAHYRGGCLRGRRAPLAGRGSGAGWMRRPGAVPLGAAQLAGVGRCRP